VGIQILPSVSPRHWVCRDGKSEPEARSVDLVGRAFLWGQMDLLRRVIADANDRLARGMGRHDREQVGRALQELIEARLPDPRMPKGRSRDLRNGNPHRMWRWVGRDGMVLLVAEVLPDWQHIGVSAYLSTGLQSHRLYRDVGKPKDLALMLGSALRHLHLA
jgi:hypothetical protein